MTLLEVLICIFVMGIGILAIAKLMTNNIKTIAKVHDRTTATTLAREWLEMINNVRDTNILLGYERNCAQRSTQQEIENMTDEQSLCKSFFWTGDNSNYNYIIDGWLQINTGQITMQRIAESDLLNWSKLYMTGIDINWTTVYWYIHKHSSSDKPSIFSRYIQFNQLSWLANNSALSISDIHVVRSIVLYERNGITGQVMLESFIANKE